jgi:hypothetical protein
MFETRLYFRLLAAEKADEKAFPWQRLRISTICRCLETDSDGGAVLNELLFIMAAAIPSFAVFSVVETFHYAPLNFAVINMRTSEGGSNCGGNLSYKVNLRI